MYIGCVTLHVHVHWLCNTSCTCTLVVIIIVTLFHACTCTGCDNNSNAVSCMYMYIGCDNNSNTTPYLIVNLSKFINQASLYFHSRKCFKEVEIPAYLINF